MSGNARHLSTVPEIRPRVGKGWGDQPLFQGLQAYSLRLAQLRFKLPNDVLLLSQFKITLGPLVTHLANSDFHSRRRCSSSAICCTLESEYGGVSKPLVSCVPTTWRAFRRLARTGGPSSKKTRNIFRYLLRWLRRGAACVGDGRQLTRCQTAEGEQRCIQLAPASAYRCSPQRLKGPLQLLSSNALAFALSAFFA